MTTTTVGLSTSDSETIESLRSSAADARLGAARIQVLEAETGRPLIERSADLPAETASVMKAITCAVALKALGPDHRIITRVVRGNNPGEVVLVGGGDVTLSRVAGDGETFYQSPARLDVLAQRTLDALGGTPPTRIVLDDSLFAGGEWLEGQWQDVDREAGDISRISSLQTDGDRDDPAVDDSSRGVDPTGRAGAAFANFLGGDPEIVLGRAPHDALTLASVESQPIEALVRETMRTSDNSLAEALARLAVQAAGYTPDFEGIAQGLVAELETFGVPTAGMQLLDGSGMAPGIRVPASSVADLMRRARLREGALGLLDDRLSRSGTTMSATRFVGENAIVGDAVRAKSGFIESVHSLAGIVRTVGGNDLVFAVFAMGIDMLPDAVARSAVDDFVTKLHTGGDALLTLSEPLLLPA